MAVDTTWTNPATALGSGGLDVATNDTLPETYFDKLASDLNHLGGSTGASKTGALGVTGLTGATAASRYVGATASSAPASGTFAVGDFVIDQTGKVHVCTVAGTPGTWVEASAGAAAHIAASAAVHGLPASVHVLGNRNAAGEFVQHGVSGDVSTSAATSFTQAGEVAVTFPVAHAAAPRVFAGGNYIGAILCYAKDISTTGCTLGAVRGDTQTVKINYITLGT